MASGAHNYSANEANEACFRDIEADEIQENDQQVYFKNYYFCFILVQVSTMMLALCGHHSTVLKYSITYSFLAILISFFFFLFHCR